MKLAPCLAALSLIACADHTTASPAEAGDVVPQEEMTNSNPETKPSELPYARGNTFDTLDEYLAYLEQYNGPIDLPYWRKIKPDLYQEVSSMPEAQPETATRAELMERFGFER